MSAKPTKLLAPTYPYNEEEIDSAIREWGCNCGPSALATMVGLKPNDVRHLIPGFESKKFTNPSMMKFAIQSLGLTFSLSSLADPYINYGLIRIQWDGPWCAEGSNPKWAYRQTHWVGGMVYNGLQFIFDINSGWESYTAWKNGTAKELAKSVPRSNGECFPTHRWELSFPVEQYPAQVLQQ